MVYVCADSDSALKDLWVRTCPVDECAEGTHDCSSNGCNDTITSFVCGAPLDVNECTLPSSTAVAAVTSNEFINLPAAIDGVADSGAWPQAPFADPDIFFCSDQGFITLDLGAVVTVTQVKYWMFSNRRYCNQTVDISENGDFGGEETRVFACTDYNACGFLDQALGGGSAGGGRLVTVDRIRGRYVRVGASRNSINTGVHIFEIEPTYDSGCYANAFCENTDTSFTCTCLSGYSDTGTSCVEEVYPPTICSWGNVNHEYGFAWNRSDPLRGTEPSARAEIVQAQFEDRFYVLGGTQGTAPTTSDPALSGTHATCIPLPICAHLQPLSFFLPCHSRCEGRPSACVEGLRVGGAHSWCVRACGRWRSLERLLRVPHPLTHLDGPHQLAERGGTRCWGNGRVGREALYVWRPVRSKQ